MPANGCCCGGGNNTDPCMITCNQMSVMSLLIIDSSFSLNADGTVFSADEFSVQGYQEAPWGCSDFSTCTGLSPVITIERSLTDVTTWTATFIGQSSPSFTTNPGWPACPPFDDYSQTAVSFWKYITGAYTPYPTDIYVETFKYTSPPTGSYTTTGTLTVLNLMGNQTLSSFTTTPTPTYPVWDGTLVFGGATWGPENIPVFGSQRAILLADGTYADGSFIALTITEVDCGLFNLTLVTSIAIYSSLYSRAPYGVLKLFSNLFTVDGPFYCIVGP